MVIILGLCWLGFVTFVCCLLKVGARSDMESAAAIEMPSALETNEYEQVTREEDALLRAS